MDLVPAAVVRQQGVGGGLLILLLLAAHGSQGCRQPLSPVHPSPSALAAAVLSGIQARDEQALRSLALSEAEFRREVWPQLPAARPERNLPFLYVWGDLHQKSEASLARTIQAHAGVQYVLVDVQFGGRTDYPSFRVHRRAAFVVRDSSGQQSTIRVCGSVLEADGRWKVFSYVVDE